jgi:Tfp pilus assembly protein PilF
MIKQGWQYHKAGHLDQAEMLYQQVLQADPTHAEAHHQLGILAHQTGHPQAAGALIKQALALNPNAAVFHYSLGIVQTSQRQLAEAIN